MTDASLTLFAGIYEAFRRLGLGPNRAHQAAMRMIERIKEEVKNDG